MSAARGEPTVAYVMSRFPKLTETFILYEILALERAGVRVEIFPLLRERAELAQPEALPLVRRAHYLPFLSLPILRSQAAVLARRPRAYLGALWTIVRANWGSRNFLIGGVGIFPKAVHAGRMMRRLGVTHVHCHFANHPAAAGYVIARTSGLPYSFTAHGSDLHVDRHMLCEKVDGARWVAPISDYNRELIVAECGERVRAKLQVVHCGVDTSVFAERDGLPENARFIIACVGTLHEVKGQAYLIEACRRLVAQGVDLELHLVGDGVDRPMLERQVADAGLGHRVAFEGSLTRDAIAALLRRADVLVTPSVPTAAGKREGIPVVLMEAMSSGVPVVASDLSGIPELVEHERSGLLVPPRDPEALATALRRLHDDPALRRALGAAGRSKVVREFDVTTNAQRLAARFAGSAPTSVAR